MVLDHPAEAAVLASLVLSELFEATLFADDDEAAVGAFVQALNGRLAEIALRRGAGRAWAACALRSAEAVAAAQQAVAAISASDLPPAPMR